MLRIADHASKTDVGRQRHTNEDAFYDQPPLFAWAEGAARQPEDRGQGGPRAAVLSSEDLA